MLSRNVNTFAFIGLSGWTVGASPGGATTHGTRADVMSQPGAYCREEAPEGVSFRGS